MEHGFRDPGRPGSTARPERLAQTLDRRSADRYFYRYSVIRCASLRSRGTLYNHLPLHREPGKNPLMARLSENQQNVRGTDSFEWAWVDEEQLKVGRHLRHVAPSDPGEERQSERLIGWVTSQQRGANADRDASLDHHDPGEFIVREIGLRCERAE